MIEVGDRVEVNYFDWNEKGDRTSGPKTVTGRLTNYRVGWLTVQPDEGEQVTVTLAPKGLRRLWPTDIEKVEG